MKKLILTVKLICTLILLTICYSSKAQFNPKLGDYVLLSGPDGTGSTTMIGSSITINNGVVGGYKLVQTTGTVNITAPILSDYVILTNSNTVNGDIYGRGSTGTVISIGNSAFIGGSLFANGNINFGGGTITGSVTTAGTYTGSNPNGSKNENTTPTPPIPAPPALPTPANLSIYPVVTTNITDNIDAYPITAGDPSKGNYGNINFSGKQTLTLNGSGVYVINSFNMTGNSNKIIFDFQGNSSGKFYVYVRGNAELGKLTTSVMRGGSANNVYMEVQGDGNTSVPGSSVVIANGSGGGTKMTGTIFALKGINVGAGTGSTSFTGALLSRTSINIQSGVTIDFAGFDFCTPPTVSVTSKTICAGQSTTLTANASPSGGTYLWSNGQTTQSITVSPTSTTNYSVKYSIGSCSTTASATVTVNASPTTANAGPNQTGSSTCGLTTVTLAANTPTVGTGSWSKVSGTGGAFGNISSPSSTFSGNAGGTYVLKWSITNGTCPASTSNVTITFNQNPGKVQADIDENKNSKPLDFDGTAMLTGSVSSDVASILWSTTNGVIDNPPATQITAKVLSAGMYSIKGTTSAGCFATDDIEVTFKLRNIIGSELTKIYESYNDGTLIPAAPNPNYQFFGFRIVNGIAYVLVDFIFKKDPDHTNDVTRQAVIDKLSSDDYGLLNTQQYPLYPYGTSPFSFTGFFPISNLLKLNTLFNDLIFCRPYYTPELVPELNTILISSTGETISGTLGGATLPIASEGDVAMRSDLVKRGYEFTDVNGVKKRIDGKGVKIGVLSDSYRTVPEPNIASTPYVPVYSAADIANQTYTILPEPSNVAAGDLPALDNSHVTDFFTRRTDEGRAMMQMIHKVAPGAELYFRTGVYTPGDMAKGIKDLANLGCKIIVEDISFPSEPSLKDGVIAQAVKDVTLNNKVIYVSSAGNVSNNGYTSPYHGIPSTNFPGKMVHDFGSGDEFQHIKLKPGENYLFVLQWADNIYSIGETEGSAYNLDLLLTKRTDGTALIGYNNDNFGDPIEFIPYHVPEGDDGEYNVVIVNNTTTGGPAYVRYIVYKNSVEFTEYHNAGNWGTISAQANSPYSFTTGAVRYNHIPGHPHLPDAFAGITRPKAEPFSSTGGTPVITESGIEIRTQPKAMGPDGVNVTVKMGYDYPNCCLNGYPNFFGTSAGAPNAAAVFALVLQGRYEYLGENIQNSDPEFLKTLLQKSAFHMSDEAETYNYDDPGTATYDHASGAGLINADKAMRTFAAPKPFEISLVKETGKIPCQDPFELTIVGENFSSSTIVYLVNYLENGDSTETIITTTTDPLTLGQIIEITDNKIKVSIATCVGNPGVKVYTPPLTTQGDGGFSNVIKLFSKEIIVQTNNVSKKYGQINPVPTVTATLVDNGISTPIAPSDFWMYGIDDSKLNLTQTVAGLYTTVGVFDIIRYRTFDKNNGTDLDLTSKYRYLFVSGSLTIDKLPLRVTPNSITANYGYDIGIITNNFEFPSNQPANPTQLKDLIKQLYDATTPGNVLAVIKDFKKQQADGSILSLSDAGLANLNTQVSFNALSHSRKFKVENGKLVPETDQNNISSKYIVDIASESLFDYKTNKTTAKFYGSYPGITGKALLGKTALDNYPNGKVILSGGSGTLQPLINGNNGPVLLSGGTGSATLAPLVNGNLVTILDGVLATLNPSTHQLEPVPNSPKIQYQNNAATGGVGSLAYIVNGPSGTASTLQPLVNSSGTIIGTDGSSIPITNNNSYVIIPNEETALHLAITNGGGTLSLNYLINSGTGSTLQYLVNNEYPVASLNAVQLNVSNQLAYLVNGPGGTSTLQPLINGAFIALNGGTGGLGLAVLVNGAGSTVGTLAPLVNGAISTGTLAPLVNDLKLTVVTNGQTSTSTLTPAPLTNSGGGSGGESNGNNTAVIVDETDVNAIASNYLGLVFGVNTITGLDVGTQKIIPAPVPSQNFNITYVNGNATIQNDPCLLTHSVFKNFGNTPTGPTSLWMSMTTKVSGQLNAKGKYLLFKGGSITLNNVNSTPTVTDLEIPDGKIIADDDPTLLEPKTKFDLTTRMWITRVPVNYASSSDIFITGAIINSSTGFIKKNGNTSSVVKGDFFSNVTFMDQWGYGLAGYQVPPTGYLTYDAFGAEGSIAATNIGSDKAGTPLQFKSYLVGGGSSGGGNSYTGSVSSYDNFTACSENQSGPSSINRDMITSGAMESDQGVIEGIFSVHPNPASSHIFVTFAPAKTGNSKISIYTIDGRKAIEINNGVTETGKVYLRAVDIGKLIPGVYLLQLLDADNTLKTKKIIINR